MAWLRKRRLKRGRSTLLVADKVNAGQAGTISVVVTKGLVSVCGHSVTVLLSVPFVPKRGSVAVLNEETTWLMVRHQPSRFSARVGTIGGGSCD